MEENKCVKTIWEVWAKMVILFVAFGFVMRIVLALHPITEANSLKFWQWLQVFCLGAVNDALAMSVLIVPLLLFLLSSGHWKLHKPQCYVLMGILAVLWAWVMYGWKSLREFNGSLCDVIGYVIIFWIASLTLRTFVPRIRKWWMRSWTALIIFIYLVIVTLNACGVWLFWDEFGVRYNFIAVDYLIYTNEVVGNIMQSYSMGWIIAIVLTIAIALEWLLFHRMIWNSPMLSAKGWRWQGAITLTPALLGVAILPLTEKLQHDDNVWCNQLQANEAYCFVDAFMKNHLDYREFYHTIPNQEMRQISSQVLDQLCDSDSTTVRLPKFIVLVTMESMSADYMRRFGNTQNLTPTIDSLWNHSLAFDNLFATGNRTVRGLEAITLSRPPAPGESIIKRPEQVRYPSIADMLQQKGYTCSFYYGGDAYFDNMGSFFGNLGYEVHDRTTMDASQITCQTIWGVCDGDVYNRLLVDLDSAYANNRPTYVNLLTTSNHRPYIYPDGCVSIPPAEKSRAGAVMYSDYALGQFLNSASKRPWNNETIYIIVADHCASSAGSTQLPLGNYHIPALIYAPEMISPQIIDATASQIDIMPTLFSLLGWEQDKNLYGRNVLSPCYQPRAFLATYQDLGYLQDDILTVLSPGRKIHQFQIDNLSNGTYSMEEISALDSIALKRATALYQLSSQ